MTRPVAWSIGRGASFASTWAVRELLHSRPQSLLVQTSPLAHRRLYATKGPSSIILEYDGRGKPVWSNRVWVSGISKEANEVTLRQGLVAKGLQPTTVQVLSRATTDAVAHAYIGFADKRATAQFLYLFEKLVAHWQPRIDVTKMYGLPQARLVRPLEMVGTGTNGEPLSSRSLMVKGFEPCRSNEWLGRVGPGSRRDAAVRDFLNWFEADFGIRPVSLFRHRLPTKAREFNELNVGRLAKDDKVLGRNGHLHLRTQADTALVLKQYGRRFSGDTRSPLVYQDQELTLGPLKRVYETRAIRHVRDGVRVDAVGNWQDDLPRLLLEGEQTEEERAISNAISDAADGLRGPIEQSPVDVPHKVDHRRETERTQSRGKHNQAREKR
jgi:hypothetical protein